MKIVINSGFGGYSLSPKAIQMLAKLNGHEVFFFKPMSGIDWYEKITTDEAAKCFHFIARTVDSPPIRASAQKWAKMSAEEKDEHNKQWSDEACSSCPENRADPKLVQVVEALGSEANGACASLKVVEIPDDVDWEIDEYDGSETIREKHRSWD